jgi:enolase-phosphatase E1
MRALPASTRAVLLDVEGTVGDVRFVVEVLFPYARDRLAAFVARRAESPEVAPILAEAAALARLPAGDQGGIVRALEAWSDTNAKVGPLKALQGMIWQDGYRDGLLRAHLYDDVPAALRGWRERGIDLAIYSSGSVLAQRLYFAHSSAGDLTPLLRAHFDTAIGAKGDRASYERIATALAVPGDAVSFFSDSSAEIDAARAAGMWAIRVDRARGPEEQGIDAAGNEWWGSIGEG